MRYSAGILLSGWIFASALGVSDKDGQTDLTVERGPFTRYSTFTGELQAAESVDITAPSVSSKWEFAITYMIEEGSEVAPGDLLARFDASDLVLNRLEAEKKREEARLKIAEKKTELDSKRQDLLIAKAKAEKDFRIAELDADIDPQLIARSQYEERHFKLETARVGIEKAQERLGNLEKTAKADLDLVELEYQRADIELTRILRDLERMRIEAPTSGLVLYKENWSTGRKWQVGDSIHKRETLMELPKLDRFMVRAKVHHSDVAGLRFAAPVDVVIDAYPHRTFTGQVVALPEVARARSWLSDLKYFTLQVELNQTDPEIMKPGMTARIRLAHTLPDALSVPRKALRVAPDGASYVMIDRSPPQRVEVQLIDANHLRAAVEGTLEPGQRLLGLQSDANDLARRNSEWIPIKRDDLDFHVSATGALKAQRAVFVRPPTLPNAWRFKIARMAPEGDEVNKGDFLVQFDPTDFQKRLTEEQANLAKVQKELEKNESSFKLQAKDLELELEEAKAQREKAQGALVEAREFRALKDVEKARLEAEFARLNVEALERKLESQATSHNLQLDTLRDKESFYHARLESSHKALDALTVTAPISGVLIYVPSWNNEKKKVGDQAYTRQNIFSIPDLRTLRVEAQVAEIDAGRLSVGQKVSVTLDAIPDETFWGRIAEIGTIFRQADWFQAAKVLDVQVELEEVDTQRMRPDMATRLKIVVDHFEDVLAVPLSVIQVEGKDSYVWVKSSQGEIEKRRVQVGQNNGIVAIIKEGLTSGEEVASRPLDAGQ